MLRHWGRLVSGPSPLPDCSEQQPSPQHMRVGALHAAPLQRPSAEHIHFAVRAQRSAVAVCMRVQMGITAPSATTFLPTAAAIGRMVGVKAGTNSKPAAHKHFIGCVWDSHRRLVNAWRRRDHACPPLRHAAPPCTAALAAPRALLAAVSEWALRRERSLNS